MPDRREVVKALILCLIAAVLSILQVIAVTNFKGGSGKTTTSAHLSQYLALQGYRVLTVDLDPQASLSALLGVLPESDIRANETLYAAIRYDETRRPLRDVIRPTYFDGLHLVPGISSSWSLSMQRRKPCLIEVRGTDCSSLVLPKPLTTSPTITMWSLLTAPLSLVF
nr:hypothetical protein K4M19_00080 [Agrobacterium fabrum]